MAHQVSVVPTAKNGCHAIDSLGIPRRLPFIVRGVSLKRVGLPGDIAEVVAFLASDASGWITGQVLTANGGQVVSATVLKNLP